MAGLLCERWRPAIWGTEYLCRVYTTQITGLYTTPKGLAAIIAGIHHPEITELYTIKCRTLNLRSGIHHPEITGLYTVGLYVTIVEMEKILCNHCTLFLRR